MARMARRTTSTSMTSALLVAALLGGCGDDSTGSASASGTSDTAATTDASSSSGVETAATTDASGTNSGSASGSTSGSTSTDGTGTDTGTVDPCTSMIYWTKGDLESPLMHPGKACLDCHDQQIGEDVKGLLGVAGTVYPSFHEPDDCNGVDGAAEATIVEITTADNQVLMLPVNSAGNFMYDQVENGPITFPIKAKVRRGGNEASMVAAQMTGDCNSCHTESGTMNAPGRIVAP
ncbi:MAG: hypothetical protein R3B09_01280 [Nannocystaceae bacterium]